MAAEGWEAEVLAGWRAGERLGAVGKGRSADQLDHARALAQALRPLAGGGRVLDLGTGAGIPGLALAGCWPECAFVLLDASARRLAVVRRVVEALEWEGRVRIAHARAEDAGHDGDLRAGFDLVVARSFAAPAVVAECGAPFLRVGGTLAVTEPAGDAGADRWVALEAFPDLGLRRSVRLSEPRVQLLEAVALCHPRFPRAAGRPAKRPLF